MLWKLFSRVLFVVLVSVEFGLSSLPAVNAAQYTAVGDSLTFGLNATPRDPNGFAFRIRDFLNPTPGLFTFTNRGVVGATAPQVLSGQVPSAITDNPNLVTLTVGSNDVRAIAQGQETVAQFDTAFNQILTSLRGASTNPFIVAANVPDLSQLPAANDDPTTPAPGDGYAPTPAQKAVVTGIVNQVNASIALRAAQHNVPVVDLFGDPRTYDPANISSDGVHPNNNGHANLAQAFLAIIAPTFTVTNTNDSGPGSLRQAIINANTQANSTVAKDLINFAIPGAGPHTIAPTTALPPITSPVTIDGYTQPGSTPSTLANGSNAVLKVEISGANAGASVNGLTINAGSSTVLGLVINRFTNSGILLNSNSNVIQGNFIGTNVAGTSALGNSSGVLINGSSNIVGGTLIGTDNVLSGNSVSGITIAGGTAISNVVQGNLIGTNFAGTAALGNGKGIIIDSSSNNLIGGTAADAANTIAFNREDGVAVINLSVGNTINANNIFRNSTGFANDFNIDLGNDGVTPNDVGDADTGPNNLQNAPVLTVATRDGSVAGSLNSLPNTTFRIEIFSFVSGFFGQGQVLANAQNVTTDANGNATFTANFTPVPFSNPAITATATNLSTGDTSEYSGVAPIPNDPPKLEVPPGQAINQDAPLVFRIDPNDRFNVFDESPVVQATVTVTNGTFVLTNKAGLVSSNANGSANTTATFTADTSFTGRILEGIVFTPDAGFTGQALMTITINDLDTTRIGGPKTATDTVPISVNPAPRVLSINSATVTEGNSGTTNATFTVTLSAGSVRPITVQFATADGTATAGSDYNSFFGTLTFDPGVTSRTIVVQVRGDVLNEAPETFLVRLFNPTGANVSISTTGGTGTGTILNDDPVPSLSIANATVTEGDSGFTNVLFTVTLSAASGQPVLVTYRTGAGTAASGDDFAPVSGNVSFLPGQTTTTITVLVRGDLNVENNETFTVNLLNPVNASISRAQAGGVIVNDDTTPTAPAPRLTISFNSPGNGAVVNSLPTIRGTVGGATGLQVRLVLRRESDRKFFTGSGWGDTPTPITAPVTNNTFTVPATALPSGDLLRDDTYTVGAATFIQANLANRADTLLTFTLDRNAPTVTITAPVNNRVLRTLSEIAGRATDVAFGTGVQRVEVYLRRASDGAYYNGTQFVAPGQAGFRPNGFALPTTLTGSRWVKSTGLPSAAQLTPGFYRILAKAYDGAGHSDLEVATFRVPAPTTVAPAAAASSVALSTATAEASTSSITLRFAAALDAESAADATHYTVAVNGRAIAVESAAYNIVQRSVTLSLPEGALPSGAKVTVRWSGLLDAQGNPVTGQSGVLTAR